VCRSLTEHIRVRQHQENGHVPNGISHAPEPDVSQQPDAGSMVLAPAPQAAHAPAPQEGQDPTTLQRQHALSNYIRSATGDFGAVSSWPSLQITVRQLCCWIRDLIPLLLLGLDRDGTCQALLGGFHLNGTVTTTACATGGEKSGACPCVRRP